MTAEEVRDVVLRVLGTIAPEVDPSDIDPHASLRDQLDIDSVDFLNFAVGIHKELGVDIPDADLPKLSSLDGCVSYLVPRTKKP